MEDSDTRLAPTRFAELQKSQRTQRFKDWCGWLAAIPGKNGTRLAWGIDAERVLRDGTEALPLATTSKALRDLESEGDWTLPVGDDDPVARNVP